MTPLCLKDFFIFFEKSEAGVLKVRHIVPSFLQTFNQDFCE